MSQQPSKKKPRYSHYAKGIIIVGVIIIAGYSSWLYYSYYLQQTKPVLQANDFLVAWGAPPSGCVFTNETSGQTVLVFYIDITNRLNTTVHLVNASLRANVLLSNGTSEQLYDLSYAVSSPRSNIIRLTVYVPVAGRGYENGSVISVPSVNGTLFIKEVNGALIFASPVVDVSRPYPECSL